MHIQNFDSQNNIIGTTLSGKHQLLKASLASKRWTLLVSNTIKFKTKPKYAIHLNSKNDQQQNFDMLSHIITAGQCELLYIEGIELTEQHLENLTHLSIFYRVKLVQLAVNSRQTQENIGQDKLRFVS